MEINNRNGNVKWIYMRVELASVSYTIGFSTSSPKNKKTKGGGGGGIKITISRETKRLFE